MHAVGSDNVEAFRFRLLGRTRSWRPRRLSPQHHAHTGAPLTPTSGRKSPLSGVAVVRCLGRLVGRTQPMTPGVCDGLICRTPDEGGTMGKVIAAITTSVDGYIVGPQDGPDHGLGIGGERLHYWVMGGPWTYADDSHDTDGMHGADREFFESLTDGLGCG